MRQNKKFSAAGLVMVLAIVPMMILTAGARAQELEGSPATQTPPAPVTLEDRRKALNDLFHDYWEDYLKHNPEFASSIGDMRWNDEITDYSVQAVNDELARERKFLLRLAAIDPSVFTDDEKVSQELLIREFEEDDEAADFKEWEM